jgi:hypothetical protein
MVGAEQKPHLASVLLTGITASVPDGASVLYFEKQAIRNAGGTDASGSYSANES